MTTEEMEILCEIGTALDDASETVMQLQRLLGQLSVSDSRVDASFSAHDAERSLELCWRKVRDEIGRAFKLRDESAVSRNGADPSDEIPF